MKNSFLYFSLFCIVLTSCSDNDTKSNCQFQNSSSSNALVVAGGNNTPKYPCDYMMASKNGAQWTVHASSSFGIGNDTLYVFGQGYEESMVFKLRFTGPGIYEIPVKSTNQYINGIAYYYLTLGGDVIIGNYILTEKSVVEIVEYDKKERVIKGTFNFPFTEFSGSSTLNFKNGKFSIHLPD